MPFGTREKDNGEKIPSTPFGIMGDPDAHKDLDKVNPVVLEAKSGDTDAGTTATTGADNEKKDEE